MQFYRRKDDVTDEMEEMNREGKTVTPTPSAADMGPVSVKQLFVDPDLRRPLLIACALAVIQQFSGINAVRRLHEGRRTIRIPLLFLGLGRFVYHVRRGAGSRAELIM